MRIRRSSKDGLPLWETCGLKDVPAALIIEMKWLSPEMRRLEGWPSFRERVTGRESESWGQHWMNGLPIYAPDLKERYEKLEIFEETALNYTEVHSACD